MVPKEGLRKAAAGQCQTHGRELLDTFRRRQDRMHMRQAARLNGIKSPTLVLEKVYMLLRESDGSDMRILGACSAGATVPDILRSEVSIHGPLVRRHSPIVSEAGREGTNKFHPVVGSL